MPNDNRGPTTNNRGQTTFYLYIAHTSALSELLVCKLFCATAVCCSLLLFLSFPNINKSKGQLKESQSMGSDSIDLHTLIESTNRPQE
jgi:hypothetical protein